MRGAGDLGCGSPTPRLFPPGVTVLPADTVRTLVAKGSWSCFPTPAHRGRNELSGAPSTCSFWLLSRKPTTLACLCPSRPILGWSCRCLRKRRRPPPRASTGVPSASHLPLPLSGMTRGTHQKQKPLLQGHKLLEARVPYLCNQIANSKRVNCDTVLLQRTRLMCCL